jgi:hypothetical protein
MPKRQFAGGMFDESRLMVVLRRVVVPLVAVQVVLATWSGYRAIVQVFSLNLRVAEPVVHSGSTVHFDVVTSGRVWVTVTAEMIQGTHAETLAVESVPSTRNPSQDPRTRQASQSIVLSPEVLARFASGPALVRVTALGRPQWLRTPPPTVRQATVTIRR